MECPKCKAEVLPGKERCNNCGVNINLAKGKYKVPDDAIVHYQAKKDEENRKASFFQYLISFIVFAVLLYLMIKYFWLK